MSKIDSQAEQAVERPSERAVPDSGNGSLCDAMHELLSHYRRTAKELEELSSSLEGLTSTERMSDGLKSVMQSIESHQPQYETVIKLWNANTQAHTPQAAELKRAVENTIQHLIKQVRALEVTAIESRSRLLPQLNTAALGQQASAAYQRTHNDG